MSISWPFGAGQVVGVAALLPLPVGFPQKLQGSARHHEASLDNIFIQIHTQQTARLRLCSLLLYLQLCCPFYLSSIGC